MKITFIGTGIMGSRMAANLLKNNVELTVWNRTAAKAEALQAQGAKVSNSSVDAVQEADIVFSMLAHPEAVESIANDFVPAMKPGSIWADCSTVNPSFTQKMAELATAHEVKFLDTPVAGSKKPATDGALVFLVGGDEADVNTLRPYLDIMGKKVIHAGEQGKGASMKMLVNLMLAQSMVAFSEAVLLGENLGMDKNFLLDALSEFPVIAPFVKDKAQKMKVNDYEEEFPLELMQKDLHLAATTAWENNTPMMQTNAAKEIYAAAKSFEYGREDMSAIYKFLTELKK